jgi:hypothetical protein
VCTVQDKLPGIQIVTVCQRTRRDVCGSDVFIILYVHASLKVGCGVLYSSMIWVSSNLANSKCGDELKCVSYHRRSVEDANNTSVLTMISCYFSIPLWLQRRDGLKERYFVLSTPSSCLRAFHARALLFPNATSPLQKFYCSIKN